MKRTSTTRISRSSNVLEITISGVQDEVAVRESQLAVKQFVTQMQGKDWAKLTDLREYLCATIQGIDQIEASMKQQMSNGLKLNVIVMPHEAMGKWQVESYIQKLGTPQMFIMVSDIESGLAELDKHGFDTTFILWNSYTHPSN